MTTAIAERKAFSIEPITYPVLAEKIGELSAEYMPLRVNGLDDAKGLKIVHDARMVVRNLRVSVEKKRKQLKADSLEYGRQVDSAAKALTDLLAPIEDHLQAEEDTVENEKVRIKAAAEEAKRVKVAQRYAELSAAGYTGEMMDIPDLSDEAFAGRLKQSQAEKVLRDREAEEARQREAAAAAERARQEADAAEKRRQEEAALAAERERLAAIQKQQDEQAAKLRAEQKRIDDEAAAQRRAIELENVKREAADKARVETEQRIARAAAENEAAKIREARRIDEQFKADEAARLKAEAEKPQRDKLMAVADAVDKIDVPDGPGSDAANAELERCAVQIRKIANGPLEASHA